jgi:hypothetical protein
MSMIVSIRTRGQNLVLFGPGIAIEVNADRNLVRHVRLPVFANDLVPLNVDDYLLAAPVMLPGDSLQLLHIVGPTGELRAPVLTLADLSTDPSDTWSVVRFLSTTPDGGAWAASANRYHLQRVKPSGELGLAVQADREWFPAWTGYVENENFASPPRPRLAGAVQRSADELCVLAYVSDANWRPAEQNGEISLDRVNFDDIFDSIVEVIDTDGVVHSSGRFDQLLKFVDGKCTLYSMQQSPEGAWQAHVYEPVIDRP